MFWTHVPQDPNCEVCKLTKTSRSPCRNRPAARGDRVHSLGKLSRRISKFSMGKNESRCGVVVQDLYSSWILSYPTKNETARETMGSCKTSCRQVRNQVLLLQTILWNLSVLLTPCVGITTSQPRADQTPNGIAKHAVRKVVEISNRILLFMAKHAQIDRQKVIV